MCYVYSIDITLLWFSFVALCQNVYTILTVLLLKQDNTIISILLIGKILLVLDI